jgi:hypothetical protein
MCLFNHLLCIASDEGDRRCLRDDLIKALKAIEDTLSLQSGQEPDTIIALLLCECRILFCDADLVEAVKLIPSFKQTHEKLVSSENQTISQAAKDVLDMI